MRDDGLAAEIAYGTACLVKGDDRVTRRGDINRRTVMSCARLGWLEKTPVRWYNNWTGMPVSAFAVSPLGLEAIALLPDTAFISTPSAPKTSVDGEAARMMRALSVRHEPPEWVFLSEVIIHNHRMDAYAINCYQSQGYGTVGYEIKVSRSDFLGELRKPEKSEASAFFCHRFFFVTPKDLVRPKEVPGPYGLIWVAENGRSRIVKRAQEREVMPTWGMVAALVRRVVREYAEEVIDEPMQTEEG